MWDPGFPHTSVTVAKLWGHHRGFCIWSRRYRGTPENPGLVLGLMPGGSCKGRAFRVRRADEEAVTDYLYRREMVPGSSEERRVGKEGVRKCRSRWARNH